MNDATATATPSTACDVVGHCAGVTHRLEWVTCDLTTSLPGSDRRGVCRCLTDHGFSGAASPASKCSCPSPAQVFSRSPSSFFSPENEPWCVEIANAVLYEEEQAREEHLKDQVRRVYDSLIWPTPALIMQELIAGTVEEGSLSGLFAVGAKGRVDPLGEFYTKEGVVEYFYGSVWTGVMRVSNVNYKKIVVQNDLASARVDITFEFHDPATGNIFFSYNLTQTSVFTFNDAGLIVSLEMIIHHLTWISETLLTPRVLAPQLIQQTCYTILNVAQCDATQDPEGHYASFEECVQFMSSKDYGVWDQLRSDSFLCRFYHSNLAIARPSVHCSHSGKTGGGKCVPHPYEDYYKIDF